MVSIQKELESKEKNQYFIGIGSIATSLVISNKINLIFIILYYYNITKYKYI
jgi:hypothetical protein